MKTQRLLISGLAFVVLTMAEPAKGQGPVDSVFSYQGRLTDAGSLADGTYNMRFLLFEAPEGGAALDTYPDEGVVAVDVQDGLFSLPIEFDGALFDGNQRWLEIVVEGICLSPRQELTAAPYSLYALSSGDAFSLPFDGNVETSGSAFAVTNHGTGRAAYFRTFASDNAVNTLWVQQNGLGGVAYLLTYNAESTSATLRADNNGLGRTAYLVATNTNNTNSTLLADNHGLGRTGQFSTLNSANDQATVEAATVGSGPVLFGRTTGSGPAVKGQTTGTGQAGYFLTDNSESSSSTLIVDNNGLGRTAHFSSLNSANDQAALLVDNYGLGRSGRFKVLNSTNATASLEGSTVGTGPGVWGYTTGSGPAVKGQSNGTGNAGYFWVNNASNDEGAVFAETIGESGRAVVGQATNDGDHYNYGGYFTAAGQTGRGVYGGTSGRYSCAVSGNGTDSDDTAVNFGGYFLSAGGRGVGVYGLAHSTSNNTNYGGYFEAAGQQARGVYARVYHSGSGLRYAGYFECDSETGYGVYASVNGDYTNWAFRGEATGPGSEGAWFSTTAEDARAVYGNASSSTGGFNANIGGEFRAAGNYGYGVKALATGQFGTGVSAASTGENGVGLVARGGTSGYAAVFQGNVQIQSRDTYETLLELGEGLDYAEGFNVSKTGEIVPGTVLIIDPDNPGKLTVSSQPYDTRVAGIVAGAKGLGSGVRLGGDGFDHDVALAGRVYCNVIATVESIEPGDRLTTSAIPGYAMKVTDHQRAQGAILGKAMERLDKGETGQILVLVTLQ